MKIIQPSFEILTTLNRDFIYTHLEKCGRTCYKSEDKITLFSAPKFVKMLADKGHHTMLEFFDVQVRFIHNRGFTHELVRHRLCSFAQESTRYCDYSGEMIVIEPYWKDISEFAYNEWKHCMTDIEKTYILLRSESLSSQAARGVLPNDVKTEIVIKANLREWMHIFKFRCAESAHPDMRRVMIPLQRIFHNNLPEIYSETYGE